MSDPNQPVEGTGTAGNREAQKTAASQGGDTLAPGVPPPTPGGPDSANTTQGATSVTTPQPETTQPQQNTAGGQTTTTDAGLYYNHQSQPAAAPVVAQPTPIANVDPLNTTEGLPVISGTHQMGVQSGVVPGTGIVAGAVPAHQPVQPIAQPQPDAKQVAMDQQAASDATGGASASSQPNPGKQ